MKFLLKKTAWDFVRWSYPAMALSLLLMLGSAGSLMVKGLNLGIDFSGGILIQLRFPGPAPVKEIRHELSGMTLGDVVIQEFGTPDEVLIRVEQQTDARRDVSQLSDEVVKRLTPLAGDQGIELRRVEVVGPQVGQELTQQGILAVLYSLVAILIYVAWRFEFRFALGAVLALVHDVTITMGYFSLFEREFTLVVVAALLTVIGYSLNDTIVVYDRIRDEVKRMKRQPMAAIINEAVNQTLSRTLVTSLTVLIVLVALLIFGGEVIHDFALTLFLGVVVGTYSSVYVASPVVLLMNRNPRTAPSPREDTVAEGETDD
ncbi:MAG: protein translocase subunit SecF [Magnetococcales bacterium]|nr:protein translocase subunit SecF [Magnetococcales bacterium]